MISVFPINAWDWDLLIIYALMTLSTWMRGRHALFILTVRCSCIPSSNFLVAPVFRLLCWCSVDHWSRSSKIVVLVSDLLHCSNISQQEWTYILSSSIKTPFHLLSVPDNDRLRNDLIGLSDDLNSRFRSANARETEASWSLSLHWWRIDESILQPEIAESGWGSSECAVSFLLCLFLMSLLHFFFGRLHYLLWSEHLNSDHIRSSLFRLEHSTLWAWDVENRVVTNRVHHEWDVDLGREVLIEFPQSSLKLIFLIINIWDSVRNISEVFDEFRSW